MEQFHQPDYGFGSRSLRLATLTNTRWLAVLGQSSVLAIVVGWFGFPLPVMASFALVAMSATLNIVVTLRYPVNKRLTPRDVFAMLCFDILQLAALVYLTGGLKNPFAVLLIVPVVISAASLPRVYTLILGGMACICATMLVWFHLPLPWYPGQTLDIPFIFLAGVWGAVISCLLFTAFYVNRVANEARRLADALAATELVMQREAHLSALDGLAAAAAHELGTPLATISLVAKEMERAIKGDENLVEDARLLRTQAERCREILGRLSTLGTDDGGVLSRLTLSEMIDEIVAPHREFEVDIRISKLESPGNEPVILRNSGLIYGIGNIVENSVDFARGKVAIRLSWSADIAVVEIVDDGPGFTVEQLEHLGEPDVGRLRGSVRSREGSSGMGLGVFIAKTLLARVGAAVSFANSQEPGEGARVFIRLPLGPESPLVYSDKSRKGSI